ncbi:MAG: hypothetical protein RSC93_12200 [Erysipelotrichaceae bacterium]
MRKIKRLALLVIVSVLTLTVISNNPVKAVEPNSVNECMGCEPSHSLPCNSGYWEYRVVRA